MFSLDDLRISRVGPYELGTWFVFRHSWTDAAWREFPEGSAWMYEYARFHVSAGRLEIHLVDEQNGETVCVVDTRRQVKSSIAADLNETQAVREFLAILVPIDPRARRKPVRRAEKGTAAAEMQEHAEAGRLDEAARIASQMLRECNDEGALLGGGEGMARWGDAYADWNPKLAEWYYDKALDFLHCYGAQATSGGDGAARLLHIDPVRKKLEALRRRAKDRGKTLPS